MYYLASIENYDSLAAAIETYIQFYYYERRQRKLDRLAPMSFRQLRESAA